MNSVMSPPATKPPRRRGPRGGRGRNNNNNANGDQDVANHQTATNRTSNTPRYTPSTAAPPSAPQRQLYVPPPHTPTIPKVKILKPSAAPPTPPTPPAAPAVRATLEIRGRPPPPAPIQTRSSTETTITAVVDGDNDDKDNDKSSLPASPPPLASPKPAPAPPPPPPFETPDHKTLIRDRQAQIAAYLSSWDTFFALASAKGADEAEPNPGKRLPWTLENNSVDGAGWRPWGEYLHTGHRGT